MFDSYCLLNEKIKKHIIIYLIIVTIISTFLLLLLNKIKVPIYLEGITTLNYSENVSIKISVPKEKLNLIQNTKQILINEEKYNYQFKKIEEDINTNKITVYLIINIDKNKYSNNTTIEYKIEIAKIKIIDYLKQK